MTNEELIQAFPENGGRMKIQQVKFITDKVFEECKTYREIRKMVLDYSLRFWPEPKDVKWDHPAYREWSDYFWGNYNTGQHVFNDWIGKLQDEFIRRNGSRRSFGEACQIAADEWTRMILYDHIQDNGDQSESGGWLMILGTLVKDRAAKGITEKTIEKFRKLMADYYRSGCLYKTDKYTHEAEPYCDYHPNSPLANLLIKAGVPENSVGNICPWKTGIYIDKRDGTVVVRRYQKETYL